MQKNYPFRKRFLLMEEIHILICVTIDGSIAHNLPPKIVCTPTNRICGNAVDCGSIMHDYNLKFQLFLNRG